MIILSRILFQNFHVFIPFLFVNFVLTEWSPWNAWSLCFEQNGVSTQTRTRAWLGDPQKNPGNDMQARVCLPTDIKPTASAPPPPRPAQNPPVPAPIIVLAQADWTSWTEWSECQSLPGGTAPPFRSRWRICDRRKCDAASAQNFGSNAKVQCQPCAGQPMEQQNCPIPAPNSENRAQHENPPPPWIPIPPPPPPSPAECQWSDWSNWSSCSTTCGTGIRIRMRICPCLKCPDGPSQEEENCYNLLPCQSDGHSAPPPPPPPLPVFPAWNNEWASPFNLTSYMPGIAFNPCNYCPPMYALPCYTCLNMQMGQG